MFTVFYLLSAGDYHNKKASPFLQKEYRVRIVKTGLLTSRPQFSVGGQVSVLRNSNPKLASPSETNNYSSWATTGEIKELLIKQNNYFLKLKTNTIIIFGNAKCFLNYDIITQCCLMTSKCLCLRVSSGSFVATPIKGLFLCLF